VTCLVKTRYCRAAALIVEIPVCRPYRSLPDQVFANLELVRLGLCPAHGDANPVRARLIKFREIAAPIHVAPILAERALNAAALCEFTGKQDLVTAKKIESGIVRVRVRLYDKGLGRAGVVANLIDEHLDAARFDKHAHYLNGVKPCVASQGRVQRLRGEHPVFVLSLAEPLMARVQTGDGQRFLLRVRVQGECKTAPVRLRQRWRNVIRFRDGPPPEKAEMRVSRMTYARLDKGILQMRRHGDGIRDAFTAGGYPQ